MRHAILSTYLRLCRGEHWTPSEIGATRDFVGAYSGRLIGAYELAQFNWSESEEKYNGAEIIAKPSIVQNLVYSAQLRKMCGIMSLRTLPEFSKDGVFILPKGQGFFTPVKRSGKIVELKFYNWGMLGKKGK